MNFLQRMAAGAVMVARAVRPEKPLGGYSLIPMGNMVAGVNLNDPAEAMKAATVFRCVNLLSETVAALPWQVFKRDVKGNSERQDRNDLDWLLSVAPNDEMGAFDFKKVLLVHRLLYGNGYAEIERNVRGQPTALYFLDSRRVTPARNEAGRLVYQVRQSDGSTVILAAADMFHIKGTTLDGVCGMSVLEVAARPIATSLAMDVAQANFFAQGMRPAGFITSKGKMGIESIRSVTDFIKNNFQGVRNWWSPVPLDSGLEFTPMQATMENSQFIDLQKFSVTEICRLFGVPPHMAYDLEKATFSNIESQGLDFATYGIVPLVTPMEQEIDRKGLSDRHGGLYSKFNLKALTRGDMAARMAWYKGMSDIGAYSPNDVLRKEDENTFPGGDTKTKQAQYKPVGPGGDPGPNDPPTDPPADPKADPKAAPAALPAPKTKNGNGALRQ